MIVIWTPEAERDRDEIWNYLVVRDAAAACKVDARFDAAVELLADFPFSGHVGDIAGTRELTPHRSYRLVYEVVGDTVWILLLVHSARQWPPAGGVITR